MPSARTHHERSQLSRRAMVLLAALVAFVTLAFSSALGTTWARQVAQPAVTLLGSGSDLSVLVTAGASRVLLAAGDDPAAFWEAYGRTVPPTARRIDLLVLAGTGRQLLVPAEVAQSGRVRQIVRIGPWHRGAESEIFDFDLPTLPDLAEISLDDEVVVRIETVVTPRGADVHDFDLAWRAQIRRGQAVVTILSGTADAHLFPEAAPSMLTVALAGDDIEPFLADARVPALAVNAAHVEGRELRAAIAAVERSGLWTLRVHPGQSVRLLLEGDALRIPDDSAVFLTPQPRRTPEPT